MCSRKERGPYKKHLTGEAHGIPESTYRSQRKRRMQEEQARSLSPCNVEVNI